METYDFHKSKSYNFKQEIEELRKKGLCTFCKVEKFSPIHASNCIARKDYERKKLNQNRNFVSAKENDIVVSNVEVSSLPLSTASNRESTKESELTNSHLSSSPVKSYDIENQNSSSLDEYELSLKQFDQKIICPNDPYDFDYEVNDLNVFAI